MDVHVFRCSSDPNLYGLTRDREGANLPSDKCSGAWDYLRRMRDVAPGQKLVGVDAATLLHDLNEVGYHLTSAGVAVG